MPPTISSFLIVVCVWVEVCAQQSTASTTSLNPRPPHNLSSKLYNLTFDQFKSTYNKSYSSLAQQKYRTLIFNTNLASLNQHNSDPFRKYNMKPNQFLDISKDQFRLVYATAKPPDQHSKEVCDQIINKNGSDTKQDPQQAKYGQTDSNQDPPKLGAILLEPFSPPEEPSPTSPNQIENGSAARTLQTIFLAQTPIQSSSMQSSQTPSPVAPPKDIYIDWSTYSGSVRFQGFCGACYAFATIDTVSSHLAIYRYGFFFQLSVQQVVDCSSNGLTFGCRGGYLEGALTHIQMEGVLSEPSYPFSSGKKGFENSCKTSSGPFKLKSFLPLPQGACPTIISHLQRGPISAGISGYTLRFYDSGIFDDCQTGDPLDHAVVIVGYRSGVGWRIKNSWGVEWGDQGFGWIAEGNTCGICNMAVAVQV